MSSAYGTIAYAAGFEVISPTNVGLPCPYVFV